MCRCRGRRFRLPADCERGKRDYNKTGCPHDVPAALFFSVSYRSNRVSSACADVSKLNGKRRIAVGASLIANVYRSDPRAGRAVPQPRFKLRELLRSSFGGDLHRSISSVANPAGYAKTLCTIPRRIPKPNSLHAAVDRRAKRRPFLIRHRSYASHDSDTPNRRRTALVGPDRAILREFFN